jgi:translation initiation factor RLI1
MCLVGLPMKECWVTANRRLELRHILDRDIDKLSGGELQRFAIGLVCVQKADVSVSVFELRGMLC